MVSVDHFWPKNWTNWSLMKKIKKKRKEWITCKRRIFANGIVLNKLQFWERWFLADTLIIMCFFLSQGGKQIKEAVEESVEIEKKWEKLQSVC